MTKMLSDTNASETLAKLRIADSKIADGFIKYIHKAINGIKAFIRNKDDKQLGNLTLQLNQLQHIADLWAEGVAGAMSEFENKQKKNIASDNDGAVKYSIREDFSKEFDKAISNDDYYKNNVVVIGNIPNLFSKFGFDILKPLTITAKHLRAITTNKTNNNSHFHGLTKKI